MADSTPPPPPVSSGASRWVTIGSHNLQKRLNEVPPPLPGNMLRTSSYNYYVVLESESSVSSDEGSESVYSMQNKETDVAKDTSDTELSSRDSDDDFTTEFDVATDEEQPFVDSNNSGSSEEEVISSVFRSILNNVELLSADSEDSMSASSTISEITRPNYRKCARCLSPNNNPMFRYCEKCYKVRKDFFPPRPKRFRKKKGHKKQKDRQVKNENILTNLQTYISSQCQGTLLLEKDECNGPKPQLCLDFKNIKVPDSVNNSSFECDKRNESKSEIDKVCANATSDDECLNVYETQGKKRVHESDIDDESVSTKKAKSSLEETDENVNNKKLILSENFEKQRFLGVNMDNVSSDDISFSQPMFSSIECEVQPISKSMSDPGVQISKDDIDLHKLPHKLLTDNEEDSLHKPELSDDDNLEKKDSKRDSDSEMCITCLIEPKSGVFVHGRIAHICCCYKCSIQVWVKTKRCPVCNCRVSNVLRAFVV